MPQDSEFSKRTYDALAPLLGPHTASRALELVCSRLKVSRPGLTPMHYDEVARVLRPMLRTLVGQGMTDDLLTKLRNPEAS